MTRRTLKLGSTIIRPRPTLWERTKRSWASSLVGALVGAAVAIALVSGLRTDPVDSGLPGIVGTEPSFVVEREAQRSTPSGDLRDSGRRGDLRRALRTDGSPEAPVDPIAEAPSDSEPSPAESAARILSHWRGFMARADHPARAEEWDELRTASLAALTRLGRDTAGPLAGVARDPGEDAILRITALEALALVDPHEAVETALILLLPENPIPLRTAALQSLVASDDERVLPALTAVLADERFDGRYLAAYAMGRRHDPAAISTLAERLRTDPDIAVRCHAATALGDLRGAGSWDALTLALESEAVSSVRERIAAALTCIDLERSIPLLEALARNDPSPGVRRAASALSAPAR